MGDYTVLAEAGESLVSILWEEIQIDPQINSLIDNENRISLDSPFDLQNNDSVKLSIYLYRITENASTKNQFPVQGNGTQLRKPPLTLDLHYLVTPLVGTVTDQQIILGKVMQVFYDRAILQGTDLTGSLAASGEEVRLILNPVALEETTRTTEQIFGVRCVRLLTQHQVAFDTKQFREQPPFVGLLASLDGLLGHGQSIRNLASAAQGFCNVALELNVGQRR